MITDEDKERVRQATDILQLVGETVELRQRGQDFWGCCPFHHEKSPSFHVNPQTGLWKCFGCGAGGDVFAYVMKRESLDFPDSIRYLAERAGIELTEERGSQHRGPRRNRLMECLADAERFFGTYLMRGRGEGAAAARHYLAGRGFGSAVCRRWGLGYAPGHGMLVAHLTAQGFTPQEILAADLALSGSGRLRDRFFDRAMFPIHDEQGKCIGFGGRVLTDAKPKYLNTKDTTVFHKGKHLFAFDRARDAMVSTGTAIVCEGYTDVISMHEAGLTNVVAALGTALTLDHVKMISRFAKSRIICMFDGDAAGQRAAERTVQYVDKTNLELLCVVLPGNMDPAEYLAAEGADALRGRLDAARPLMSFVFERHLERYDLSVPGQRVAALDDLAALLSPLSDSILLNEYATQLAGLVGANMEETRRRIRSAGAKARSRMQASLGQGRSAEDEPPANAYGPYVYEGEELGGEGATPAGVPPAMEPAVTLSDEERRQLDAERELLSLMTTDLAVVRPLGERIGSLSWADGRHESMAWAMLATPMDAAPHDVVRAAEGVVPEAPQILSSGTLDVTSDMSTQQKAAFLVDVIELWADRRRVRQIQAQLKALGAGEPRQEARDLFAEATTIQRRINELVTQLPVRV